MLADGQLFDNAITFYQRINAGAHIANEQGVGRYGFLLSPQYVAERNNQGLVRHFVAQKRSAGAQAAGLRTLIGIACKKNYRWKSRDTNKLRERFQCLNIALLVTK